MAINYKGPGITLTTVPQVVYTVPGSGVRAVNIVGGMLANTDVFQRTILVSARITVRNLMWLNQIEVPFGLGVTLPVITLNLGESLEAWASIGSVIDMNLALGEQV